MAHMAIGLRARDLRVRLRNGFQLQVASFDCEPGATVCLVGANGSGKSLLLEALCGLLHAHVTGDVCYYHIADAQLIQVNMDVLRIGALVQRFGLWSKAHVSEMVRLLEACGGRPDPDDEDLWRIRDRLLGQLSTGERQYFMFCMALYSNAHLLCLDEPLLGLDAHMQDRVSRLLHADRRTTVLVTHNFAEVVAFSNRCYFMCNGRCIETSVVPIQGVARTATIELTRKNGDEGSEVLRSITEEVDNHRAVEMLNRAIIPFINNGEAMPLGDLAIRVLLSRTVYNELCPII